MATHTPFRKILIANRGEIVLRVIRSARALGYATVAVYSSADSESCHVRAADQAVCIGGAMPAESYLNIAAVVDAARRTGADAVHPGYGFLSENEDFASACADAGLIFIGPSPDAIRAMGNKAHAKRLMSKAGLLCVPGYEGEDQSESRLAAEADLIGYPVMIKAAAGGGGRGMRFARSAPEFLDHLHSAQSEARNAFGDARVILERAILEPKHIEIQIVADRYGNVVHLGERDCSIQRRHQKVVEESPSPSVSAEEQEQLGNAAVAAVKALGYEGAGTLEFLRDQAGRFYFMEMNTRLQVEHPVTEMITGLDLVALQLRIAAGEPLPFSQDDVRFDGHAIEVRLCAESPEQSFLPQSGMIALWRAPTGCRVEHALKSGTIISPYYDSMIAKFVSFGTTREEARRKLLISLEESVVLGVPTNQQFLIRCLSHSTFVAGGATTAFVEHHLAELLATDSDADERIGALAAPLLIETAGDTIATSNRRHLRHNLAVSFRLRVGGSQCVAAVQQPSAGRYQISTSGRNVAVAVLDIAPAAVRFEIDGIVESAAYVRDGNRLFVGYKGVSFVIEDRSRVAEAVSDGSRDGGGKIRSQMNGRVVAVYVAVGDPVGAGQPILTLEAMKMEHSHVASRAGIVRAVAVSVGDQVSAGRTLVEIDLDGEAAHANAGLSADRQNARTNS